MIPPFLEGDLKREVQVSYDAVKAHWDESLRPRLNAFLMEAAALEIRAALGQDVKSDRLAIRAWESNLTLEQQMLAGNAAKDAALRVFGLALSILLRIPPL